MSNFKICGCVGCNTNFKTSTLYKGTCPMCKRCRHRHRNRSCPRPQRCVSQQRNENTHQGLDLLLCVIYSDYDLEELLVDVCLRLRGHQDHSDLTDRMKNICDEIKRKESNIVQIYIYQIAELYNPRIKYRKHDIIRQTKNKPHSIGNLYRQYDAREEIEQLFIEKGGRTFTEMEAKKQGRIRVWKVN